MGENELQNLQELVAQQAMDLSHLSDELYAQQRELLALKEEVRRLRQDIQTSKAATSGPDEASDQGSLLSERPPHY